MLRNAQKCPVAVVSDNRSFYFRAAPNFTLPCSARSVCRSCSPPTNRPCRIAGVVRRRRCSQARREDQTGETLPSPSAHVDGPGSAIYSAPFFFFLPVGKKQDVFRVRLDDRPNLGGNRREERETGHLLDLGDRYPQTALRGSGTSPFNRLEAKAKTDAAATVARYDPATKSRAAAPRSIVPRTTTQYTELSPARPMRVEYADFIWITSKPILAPLPEISVHVIQPEGVR